MEAFFKGLKVVELANVLAGPAAGMFFAELGAEVTKVENKLTNGDVTRSWKLSAEDPASALSAYYASVNRGKQSIMLNLHDDGDRQKAYSLLKSADIVICNYKPGDDVKLGMDHESIRKINPGIIYAGISGFGEDVHRTAYDLVLQAETGFMHMNGTPESGPVKMPVALIDILAAHQLKEGILIALIKRMRTGEGSKVTVSLYDAAIASLANQAGNWLMANEDPQRSGSLHPNIAPYGELFITSDNKQLVLAIGNNKQFAQLCNILGCEKLIEDPRFLNNPERVKNRKALFEELKPAFINRDSLPLMEELIKNDIPAGMIRSLKEVFAEPQAASLVNSWIAEGTGCKNVKTAAFQVK
ncbi:MAG: carnitine dehydratase [Bacteroidetes bacterium]|nr:carnitine dehydratase [Bacteroidota bacterium]